VLAGRGKTPEEKERFLRSAHAKAYQIKEMSDALFDYFYVYSKPQEGEAFETVQASALLSQVLGEKALELESQGFQVVQRLSDFPGSLQVHYPLLIRAFDNLFSNILKYADPAQPVILSSRREGDQAFITLENAIDPNLKARESTKIGLTTCQRAFDYHGGSFKAEEAVKSFKALVRLPLTGLNIALRT
jgi:signal transduction histidine kinase